MRHIGSAFFYSAISAGALRTSSPPLLTALSPLSPCRYRRRHWIPKSGINFGFEWVLYSGTTRAHHSVLCVHVVAERKRRVVRTAAAATAAAADGSTPDGAQIVLGAETNVTWTTLLRSVRIAGEF